MRQKLVPARMRRSIVGSTGALVAVGFVSAVAGLDLPGLADEAYVRDSASHKDPAGLVVFKPSGEEISAYLPEAPAETEIQEDGKAVKIWKVQTGSTELSIGSHPINVGDRQNSLRKAEMLARAVQGFIDRGKLRCQSVGMPFKVIYRAQLKERGNPAEVLRLSMGGYECRLKFLVTDKHVYMISAFPVEGDEREVTQIVDSFQSH